MPNKLVLKVTAGADAPERCSQAFTVAAVAAASGVEVSLWLTGESSWFALPGRAAEFELPHAAPLPDLIDSILAAAWPHHGLHPVRRTPRHRGEGPPGGLPHRRLPSSSSRRP